MKSAAQCGLVALDCFRLLWPERFDIALLGERLQQLRVDL
jgi:hypothetical protein